METENIKKVSVSAKGKPTIVVGQFKQFGDKDVWVVSTEKIDVEVSQSFQNSLKLLVPHLLIHLKYHLPQIDLDYINKEQALKDAKLKSYVVTGIEIKGKDDDEGVVIYGKVLGDKDGASALKTQKINFYNNDEYIFSGNLQRSVKSVLEEVLSLFEGNFKTDPQGQIEFSQEGEDVEEVF